MVMARMRFSTLWARRVLSDPAEFNEVPESAILLLIEVELQNLSREKVVVFGYNFSFFFLLVAAQRNASWKLLSSTRQRCPIPYCVRLAKVPIETILPYESKSYEVFKGNMFLIETNDDEERLFTLSTIRPFHFRLLRFTFLPSMERANSFWSTAQGRRNKVCHVQFKLGRHA